ncbi:DUF1963 domain-containing protein [Sphingosinicella sp. BN140058]|uniref:DUF1963 domain-containing protein n=1 Tax=Sphingosinicella sp. BN140058 TaxID=1892855 RepID=UPI00101064F4|nr:DUF1963 domain-containing protein [Sphingosinicella sp. BN140058]QAY78935.1 DUF1963 domain-containing protein [Sphingosinicella sp. BN140058]
MRTLLLLLLLQLPFLLFMWLVPPERRTPSRKVSAWLLAGLSLLAAGSGILHLYWEDGNFARFSFVFAVCAALGAVARAKGWIGPDDPDPLLDAGGLAEPRATGGDAQSAADPAVDAGAAALLERYRRPAVLLHRPYPPHAGPPGNSHFGGLPAFAVGMEWPRTSAGVPLHFLCQVDFADMHWTTPLPDHGVLLVFVRDDDAQQRSSGRAGDDFRILYAPEAAAGPTEAPADLPPIGWDFPRGPYREVQLDGEPHQRLHVAWPIQPLEMDSFPDQSGLPELIAHSERAWQQWSHEYQVRKSLHERDPSVRRFPTAPDDPEEAAVWDRYGELLPAARAAALEAATGTPIYEEPGYAAEAQANRRVFEDGSFPSHWIFIHYFARIALRRSRRDPPSDADTAAAAIADAEARLDRAARAWFDRSCALPLESPVDETDRAAFRAWAANIRRDPRSRAGSDAPGWAAEAAFWVIRSWAGNRRLAGTIPPSAYEAVAGRFHASRVSRGGEKDWYHFHFCQMLGHATSSQEAAPADGTEVCLLNLASDRALGWSFWDCGEIGFWIAPEDLAARDFSRVRMSVNGH